MSTSNDNNLISIVLSKQEIKACINGLGWAISECDCGIPGDEVWVAEHELLTKKLQESIGEKEDG